MAVLGGIADSTLSALSASLVEISAELLAGEGRGRIGDSVWAKFTNGEMVVITVLTVARHIAE